MKAAVYYGRGDIRIESVPEPSDPRPGEVVLEVTRAAICGTDSSEWAPAHPSPWDTSSWAGSSRSGTRSQVFPTGTASSPALQCRAVTAIGAARVERTSAPRT